MKTLVDTFIHDLLQKKLLELEEHLNAENKYVNILRNVSHNNIPIFVQTRIHI